MAADRVYSLAELCSRFNAVASAPEYLIDEKQFSSLLTPMLGGGRTAVEDIANNVFNKRGKGLCFQEFCQEYVKVAPMKPVLAIQRQFELMDTDFDGKISKSEMRKHFSGVYEHLDVEQQVERLFKSMAKDKDSWIYFEALKDWYVQKLRPSIDLADQQQGSEGMDADEEDNNDRKTGGKGTEEKDKKTKTPKDTIEGWDVHETCSWMGLVKTRFGIQNASIEQLRAEECDGLTLMEIEKAMLRQMGLSVSQANSIMSAVAFLHKSPAEALTMMKGSADDDNKKTTSGGAAMVYVPNSKYLSGVLCLGIVVYSGKFVTIGASLHDEQKPNKTRKLSGSKIEKVTKMGYKDIDFLLFLTRGSSSHPWMKKELKDVFESLGFSTFEQQTCMKELSKLGMIRAEKERKVQEKGGSNFWVGQEVEYLSRTRGDWHPATIRNIRDDGSCLVKLKAGAVKIALPTMLRASAASPNSMGFDEDDETGFWLVLNDESKVEACREVFKEVKQIQKSPRNYIQTHTSVQEKTNDGENEEAMEGDDEESSSMVEGVGLPKLERQLSTRSICEEAFKDALRYASGLYGSVSKEWVLGCLQNLYMLHSEAMRTNSNITAARGGIGVGMVGEGGGVSSSNTASDMDRLRLQLEAKYAQDLESEKKRLYEASMQIIQHAEQKGNVAQLPEEKQAIQSGRFIRIKLWPTSTYDPSNPGQYHFRLAESQFFRMMGSQANLYKVQQVEYIVNPTLIKAYNSYKSQLISQGRIGVSKPIEERLAFHGTSQEVMEIILKTGLRRLYFRGASIRSSIYQNHGLDNDDDDDDDDDDDTPKIIELNCTRGMIIEGWGGSCSTTTIDIYYVLIDPATKIVQSQNKGAIQQIISPDKRQVLPSYLVHFTRR
eukprot:jgi/Bigna1/145738/aug1.103_g20446